jgi:anti-anti-sigma factor
MFKIRHLETPKTAMSQLQIKTQQMSGEPMIDMRGKWESDSLDGFIKAFQKTVQRVNAILFLRMAELDYLDSAALGVIMFHMNELSKRKARLVIVEPSPEMRDILHTASLDKVLEIR